MIEVDIKKLSKKTGLEIDKKSEERLNSQIQQVLEWCEDLKKIDTSNVSPMFTVFELFDKGIENIREDEVIVNNTTEELLSNAPSKEDVFISVPKVIETK